MVMQLSGMDAALPAEILMGCYRLLAVSASHGDD
jgi:hypothetical protein